MRHAPILSGLAVTVAMALTACSGSPVATTSIQSSSPSSPVDVSAAPTTSNPAPTSADPTTFTSRLYGYSLQLPAEWAAASALLRWDGRLQPAFGDPEVDNFGGQAKLAALAFAGSYGRGLDAFVRDRIAANARDHSDTCPLNALQVNESIAIGGETGVLLGWNCGALINQALVVRDGTAYAFTFRDLGRASATDPTDLAIFKSILETVRFPAPGPRGS